MALLVLVLLIRIVSMDPALDGANENPAFSSETRALQARAAHASESGNYDEVLALYKQEIDLLAAHGDHAAAGEVDIEMGELDQVRGELATAEEDYKEGLALLRHYAQPNDMRLVIALDDLGWLYVTWGRMGDGSHLMEEAEIKAGRARPDDPELVRHLDAQAAFSMVEGRYSDARKNWTRALEIGNASFGPESPQCANILVHFGQGSALYRDYKVAEQMLRRYLAIQGEGTSETPAADAMAAAELAHVYAELHRYSDANTWFDSATKLLKQQPDQAPLVQATVLSYLGDYYMTREDWFSAEARYREALNIQQNVLGANATVAASMISLSKALKKLHKKGEARDLVARAKAILSSQNDPLQAGTVDVIALQRQ